MKNAELWKRVLNEGILCDDAEMPAEEVKQFQRHILTSTIIVDPRVQDEEAEEGRAWRWASYTSVAFPFPMFWIEGQTLRACLKTQRRLL